MGKTTAEAQATPNAPDPRENFVVRAPATIFADASDVERIAKRLIPLYHKHLAAARIRYLFRIGGAWKTGGKDVLGKAAKLGTQQQFLSEDFDAVVLIDADRWEELDPAQREALVDHELCHYVQATDKYEIPIMQPNGRPVLKLRAHDVEEFVEVIQRHGLWDIDLVHAGKAIRQIPMELEEDGGLPDDTQIEITGPDGQTATGTVGDLKRVADMAEHRGRRRGWCVMARAKATVTAAAPLSEFQDVMIADIHVSPQVRKTFDQAALDELAASIREHGVIQPLIVRPVDPAGFELVAGERRLRASKLAGLAWVPCRVMELTDQQAAKLQLLENLQRKDLDPIEEAEGYDRLIREHGAKAVDLARELGVSEALISNRRRLLRLPEPVREEISRGNFAPATAMAVIGLSAYPDVVTDSVEMLQKCHTPSAQAAAAVEDRLTRVQPVVALKKGVNMPWACNACADHSKCPCRHELTTGHSYAKAVCLDRERYKQLEAEAKAAQPEPEKPNPTVERSAPYTYPNWEEEQRKREAALVAATEALSTEVRDLAPRKDLAQTHVALIAARLVLENDHRRDWSERMREFGFGLLIDTLADDGADDGDTQDRVLRWLSKQDVPTLLQIALTFAVEPMPGRDCGLTDWWRQRCGLPVEPEPTAAEA